MTSLLTRAYQPTIGRLEAEGGEIGGRGAETEQKIRGALEKAGIEFLNGDQPGVRLRKRKTEQKIWTHKPHWGTLRSCIAALSRWSNSPDTGAAPTSY